MLLIFVVVVVVVVVVVLFLNKLCMLNNFEDCCSRIIPC